MRLCLNSPHGAQDDGGIETCDESFCGAGLATDECSWCACAACGTCPPRPRTPPPPPGPPFVGAYDIYMFRGKPFAFMGANLWAAMHMGCDVCPGGDRARLSREIDRLADLGVTSVRILASGEGPPNDSPVLPWTVQPALQPEPGKYNHDLLLGLDFALQELGRRGMVATMVLNNAWPWSGGMAQYVQWAGAHAPPTPNNADSFKNVESWQQKKFFNHVDQFFANPRAIGLSHAHVRYLLKRRNAITGRVYADDPTIMTWELAHEPRPIFRKEDFRNWVKATAELVKSLAPKQLVTIGSEGQHGFEVGAPSKEPWNADVTEWAEAHHDKNVDYATVHVWPVAWGWQSGLSRKADDAVERGVAYVRAHADAADRMGKPLVIEEVGHPRDFEQYGETASVAGRDKLYTAIFEEAAASMRERGAIVGAAFWGWAGEGRKAHGLWQPGDEFIAETPSEYQGWNSVYDSDFSTTRIVTRFADTFAENLALAVGIPSGPSRK